ncbi:hypothetical protein EDD15DRAFT_2463949, partial [Pisolithus albus]
ARAFKNLTCHHQPSLQCAFHSPSFIALKATSQSPQSSSSAPSATVSAINMPLSSYEKQAKYYTSEPHISSAGMCMYVISEPDPSNTAYKVPYSAYPTSVLYVNYPR